MEYMGHLFPQFTVGNANDLRLCPGRIGQGPQDIKHGADSNLSAGFSGILHGWVEVRSEHKANACRLQTLSHCLSPEVDSYPQSL